MEAGRAGSGGEGPVSRDSRRLGLRTRAGDIAARRHAPVPACGGGPRARRRRRRDARSRARAVAGVADGWDGPIGAAAAATAQSPGGAGLKKGLWVGERSVIWW